MTTADGGSQAKLRAQEVLLLARAPTLLGAYLWLWRASRRDSPYREPGSFENLLRLKVSGSEANDLVYGETPLPTALALFGHVGLGRGDRLLDVGAGFGRALLAARLLGARARGVELAPKHVRRAAPILATVGIELVEGDGATTPMDATHVYVVWTCFTAATRARLLEQFATAPPGTKFIAPTWPFEHPAFRPLGEVEGRYTWGSEPVFIAERGGSPHSAGAARPSTE